MAGVASRTMVLMGHTGHGKSATGNSILGNKTFESKKSFAGITRTFKLDSCVRTDGQLINVIDTPGTFNSFHGTKYFKRKILKCLDLASEGIHAVLLVFSTKTQFTQEEEATFKTLQNLLGSKILDYAIVVFTGGDEFDNDNDGNTLDDYLLGCPVALKDILAACKGRYVLFDNKTKNKTKKTEQVNKLLDLVNEVIDESGGKAFTRSLFFSSKFEEKLKGVKDEIEKEIKEEIEAKDKEKEKLEEMEKQHGGDIEQRLEAEQLKNLLVELQTRQKMREKLEEMKKQRMDEIEILNKKMGELPLPTCTIV